MRRRYSDGYAPAHDIFTTNKQKKKKKFLDDIFRTDTKNQTLIHIQI